MQNTPEIESKGTYRFFVAGHAYQKDFADADGFSPNFKTDIEALMTSDKPADFGVLTGGDFRPSSSQSWEAINRELESLGSDVYVVPGGPYGTRDDPAIKSRNGKSFFTFEMRGDLFIVLDLETRSWGIDPIQLDFLKEVVASADDFENIFLFMDQLTWWEKDNDFRCASINSEKSKRAASNFQTDVFPLFKNLRNPVYFFAGDTGDDPDKTPMFFQDGNVTLIASGTKGDNGNFLIVDVSDNVDLSLEWIHDAEILDATEKANDKVQPNFALIEDYTIDCQSENKTLPALVLLRELRNVVDAKTSEIYAEEGRATLETLRNGNRIDSKIEDSGFEVYLDEHGINLIVRDCLTKDEFASVNLTTYEIRPVGAPNVLWGYLKYTTRRLQNLNFSSFSTDGISYCGGSLPIDLKNVSRISGFRTLEKTQRWKFDKNILDESEYISAARPLHKKNIGSDQVICTSLNFLCYRNNATPEYVGRLNHRRGFINLVDGSRQLTFLLETRLTFEEVRKKLPGKTITKILPVQSEPANFIREYKKNTVIVVVQDLATGSLRQFDLDSLAEAGIDLKNLKPGNTHISIIEEGTILLNETGASSGLQVQGKDYGLQKVGTIYSPKRPQKASVIVDGREVATRGRGLNMVAVKSGKIINSTSFNTQRSPYRLNGLYKVEP